MSWEMKANNLNRYNPTISWPLGWCYSLIDSQFKFDLRLLSVNSNPVNTSVDAKVKVTLYCYGDFEELNSQEISGLIMN